MRMGNPGKLLSRHDGGLAGRMSLALLLLTGAGAYLAGCAGSSVNSTVNSMPVYDSAGAVSTQSPTADASAFAPTGGSAQSNAAALQAADKLTSVAKPGNSAYKIGPLDVLDISVFKVPDLTKEA